MVFACLNYIIKTKIFRPQFCGVERSKIYKDKENKSFYRKENCRQNMSHNVWDIRSFSGTKWKKNLGEARAEG
jgi:hypothetical protein